MIKSITLKNFRKHQDATFGFGPGLTTLRGANEHGKSTVTEAIAYALFGVKAIRSSLAEAVTWGCAESTLKVTLVLTIEGVEYTVTRSKSGAEVNYEGGIVTGQTEVSAFMAGKLKVDQSSATKLMFSAQLDVRGALEAGPKATTELIERLANFGQIDDLIELMQEKLTLGSPAVSTAALATARAELEQATALLVPVDEAAYQVDIDAARSQYRDIGLRILSLEGFEAEALESLNALRSKQAAREAAEKTLAREERNLRALQERADSIAVPPKPVGVEKQVEKLQGLLNAAAESSGVLAVYEKISTGLKPYVGDTYPGTLESLRGVIRESELRLQDARNSIATLTGDIKLYKAQLTHGTCSFCGKDFSGVPEVAERNAATATKIGAAERDLDEERRQATFLSSQLSDMRAIEAAETSAQVTLAAGGDYVVRSSTTEIPSTVEWVGPNIDTLQSVDEKSVKRQIRALQESVTAYEVALAKRGEAQRTAGEAAATVVAASMELDSYPIVDTTLEQEDLDKLRASLKQARLDMAAASKTLASKEHELADAFAAYSRTQEDVRRAKERVQAHEAALEALTFNNALLKRVRQARPLISDKLWSIVLQAVSSYFSEIRGVKSRVTKAADGFQIDHHPITSMSGSTLDALGLAIRVALVRTFLPASPFLVLDEPSAAMDEGRTNNMLGFLSQCGFQQVILITHEEVSETVADNIITLGD